MRPRYPRRAVTRARPAMNPPPWVSIRRGPGPGPRRMDTHGGGFMAGRALVTARLGYRGRILCEHFLAAGFQVTAVDNLMYGYGQQGLYHLCANPAFDFIRGDVRDENLIKS